MRRPASTTSGSAPTAASAIQAPMRWLLRPRSACAYSFQNTTALWLHRNVTSQMTASCSTRLRWGARGSCGKSGGRRAGRCAVRRKRPVSRRPRAANSSRPIDEAPPRYTARQPGPVCSRRGVTAAQPMAPTLKHAWMSATVRPRRSAGNSSVAYRTASASALIRNMRTAICPIKNTPLLGATPDSSDAEE